MKLGETTDADKGMTTLHFGSDCTDTRIRIPDHFWLLQPKFIESCALGVGGGMRCQKSECSLYFLFLMFLILPDFHRPAINNFLHGVLFS